LVHIGGMTIGRATYEPGWKWSEHVGPGVGATRCHVEHVGLVLSGTATAAFDDGRVVELHAGELFHIPPIPHDSWVVGDERYVSLHFLGAEHYAAKESRMKNVENAVYSRLCFSTRWRNWRSIVLNASWITLLSGSCEPLSICFSSATSS